MKHIAHYHPRGCVCQQCRAEIEAVRAPYALITVTRIVTRYCPTCRQDTRHNKTDGQAVCRWCGLERKDYP